MKKTYIVRHIDGDYFVKSGTVTHWASDYTKVTHFNSVDEAEQAIIDHKLTFSQIIPLYHG